MRRTLMLSAAAALAIGLAVPGVASAGVVQFPQGGLEPCNIAGLGNASWTEEKAFQVITNRYANAGLGNLGENYNKNGQCKQNSDLGKQSGHPELKTSDDDPGNSGDNNQAGVNGN